MKRSRGTPSRLPPHTHYIDWYVFLPRPPNVQYDSARRGSQPFDESPFSPKFMCDSSLAVAAPARCALCIYVVFDGGRVDWR